MNKYPKEVLPIQILIDKLCAKGLLFFVEKEELQDVKLPFWSAVSRNHDGSFQDSGEMLLMRRVIFYSVDKANLKCAIVNL